MLFEERLDVVLRLSCTWGNSPSQQWDGWKSDARGAQAKTAPPGHLVNLDNEGHDLMLLFSNTSDRGTKSLRADRAV